MGVRIEAYTRRMFSAALRCGLIEAFRYGPPGGSVRGFPQHYAAASLKPFIYPRAARPNLSFPQHYAAASLKREAPGAQGGST